MPGETTNELLPSEHARFDEVCRFGQDKRDQVAETVALAFADDPIWQWIYDTDDSLPVETGVVLGRMLVARLLPVDEVHGFRDFGAVALWSAPVGTSTVAEQGDVTAMEERRDARTGPYFEAFAAQIGERIALTGQLSAGMQEHRPEQPHWYLGILATHPERQSQGLGGRVLATMLDRCDRSGQPAYLESSNPRNYGFYQRHGFVQTSELTVAGSPPLLGFWRPAR